MTHRLDHGQPLFPGALGEEATDLTGAEREAFFQKIEDEGYQVLRDERNLKLAETDWTQMPDVPEEVKTAWQVYRQALRDIPENYSNIAEVVWPTKPGE